MDMLTLSHVAKNFGEKQVLRDVSFSVPEHTVFGFVGKNGAGKTTAMKLILGLFTASGGEIAVNGVPVRYGNTPTNRLIGYLPDVPEFYPYMTPTEYLRFCGEISGMPVKEIKSRSEELLRLVGLEKEKHRIKGFSRGMKQRLGVAQALFSRPKLLICDEPTSALDPAGRKELLDILTAAKEETTVLFSTHILSDVEHICVELEHQEDTIILRQAFPFLKTTGKNLLLLEEPERLAELLYFIADKKLGIMRIERQEATLSDLFMEVVGK